MALICQPLIGMWTESTKELEKMVGYATSFSKTFSSAYQTTLHYRRPWSACLLLWESPALQFVNIFVRLKLHYIAIQMSGAILKSYFAFGHIKKIFFVLHLLNYTIPSVSLYKYRIYMTKCVYAVSVDKNWWNCLSCIIFFSFQKTAKLVFLCRISTALARSR
jgi:hypothetical protein